jgi:hypothetical protein
MTDWSKAKVVDLKAELKKRGLPQTGLKPALVARLTAAENDDGTESEATVQGDLKLNPSAATSPDAVSPTQPQSAENLPDAPQTTSEPNPGSNEQAPTTESENVDITVADVQNNLLPTQSANTIESSQSLSQPEPERSALPSLEPQEAIEDRQKRKRRSQSPPISSADAARKRFRKSDEAEAAKDEVTTSQSDSPGIEKNKTVDEAETNATSGEKVDIVNEEASAQEGDKMEVKVIPNMEGPHTESLEESPARTRDSRFKDLFNSPQSGSAMGVHMEKSKSRESLTDEAEPERIISPAIHPATSALYIRDFMRPLNQVQLKTYLADLATPLGREVESDIVVDFYLDPIRTHAFVSFTSVSAASRVRSSLHDRIWPEERTRKPLWVDFIPSDIVKEWIEVEESNNAAGRGSGKKWEVYYNIDEDRHVTASLQEAANVTRLQPSRKVSMQLTPQAPSVPTPAPIARRGIDGAPSGPRAGQTQEPIREKREATSLATLDQLFSSTTAKPVLYWKSVSKSIANKRLDAMEDAKSKRHTRGGQVDDDINRYTFEDGHVLVDRGPELFGGIRPPPGFRGPARGGTMRVPTSRGGYGGGGGRTYDSYRGGGSGGRGSRDFRDDRRY